MKTKFMKCAKIMRKVYKLFIQISVQGIQL